MLQEYSHPLAVERQESANINENPCFRLILAVEVARKLKSANGTTADSLKLHMCGAIEEARDSQELTLPQQIRAFALARLIHWVLDDTKTPADLKQYYDATPTMAKYAIAAVVYRGLRRGILEALPELVF